MRPIATSLLALQCQQVIRFYKTLAKLRTFGLEIHTAAHMQAECFPAHKKVSCVSFVQWLRWLQSCPSDVQEHKDELGVSDPQLQLAPLEDVFLTVVRKAELEHSHERGQVMRLVISEEHITLQVTSSYAQTSNRMICQASQTSVMAKRPVAARSEKASAWPPFDVCIPAGACWLALCRQTSWRPAAIIGSLQSITALLANSNAPARQKPHGLQPFCLLAEDQMRKLMLTQVEQIEQPVAGE